jgi:signal transduction histidine kinase
MGIVHRVVGPLLLLGGAAFLAAFAIGVATGAVGAKELPWLLLGATFLAVSAYVRARLPDHVVANWFAIVGAGFGLIQALDGALTVLGARPDRASELAVVALAYHLGAVATVIAAAHLLGLFPDGQVATSYERRALGALWVLFVFPLLAFVANPTIVLPLYHARPEVANPYVVDGLVPLEDVATAGLGLAPVAFVVGVVLLVLRYRRGTKDVRRQVRWLLVPAILAGFGGVLDTVLSATGSDVLTRLVIDGFWFVSLLTLPLAIAVALLRPELLDVDRILRRSLVYGSIWTLIAVAYVVVAAAVGLAAGQRLDVGTAIVLTVVATLIFQPMRRRLERLADRWVFGARADPARLVAGLGATLAETFDLDTLLPHIEETLEQGLGLRWVRVRLGSDTGPASRSGPASGTPPAAQLTDGLAEGHDDAPALTVPIVLGAELLGHVECGPRSNGTPLSAEDEELVVTLARQAALAVRNVKLTAELSERLQEVRAQAAELERSRARLVRAQDTERRRIERNIHDGVQQDLVALLGQSGRIRAQLARDPAAAAELLEGFQTGLQRVISELRELAHGIHPTLLTDRGLLEAVEALAARSSIPVTVRADPSLRGLRFAEEVEGAGYFTVAEALANVLKHARAARAEVSLQRSNGSLRIEIHDDGVGFDRTRASGDGLENLTERVAALGGRLDVSSDGGGTSVRAELEVAGRSVAGD